ncbi:MAG: amidohydrolase, partial [Alphaproteobacteria bacterium]
MERLEFVTSEMARIAPTYCDLSDAIWQLAEPVYGEVVSADLHIVQLERAGFRIGRNVAGIATAFVAEWGEDGPVIAILGEYDALAGLSQEGGSLVPSAAEGANDNGHGCGHHLLGAASHAAAIVTARFLEATGRSGRVRFY